MSVRRRDAGHVRQGGVTPQRQVVPPKGRFEAIGRMAEEGHPTQVSCRVLAVSESGFYEWRRRAPSARVIRHAWLTDVITQVHLESNGTYGALRVRAELTMGRGITVGHNAVAMLMRRAGPQGLPGARKRRARHEAPTASDLVERSFARAEPNRLWVADIERHEALLDRTEVKGLRPRLIAVSREKLGAA